MSKHDREQLRRWLQETEENSSVYGDSEDGSVFGVEDRDELEEDHTFDHSDEVGEEEEPLALLLNDDMDVEIERVPQGAPSQGSFINPEFYLGKDRQTVWYLDPQVSSASRTPRHNIIPTFHRPGPQGRARHAQTPVSAFQCIIDDDIFY
uniref:Uncharacterized protein n=1 Tax=Clastoptera arizonana TaxID=38151 RepID=A0A1B6BXI9_9HEMI